MASRNRGFRPLGLNFRSGLPAYRQIARQVQRQAQGGRLRPGDRLPTVRGMAQLLGVNFNTVARAYRLLGESGVVSAQPGRGTFVLDNAAGARPSRTALQTLAADYVAQARRSGFSDAQIAAVVFRRLDLPARSRPGGENHE